MRWTWLAVSVISSAIGDVISAKGMAQHGEIEQFGASSFARVLRYIVTHRLILTGIGFDAVSFLSFMALLSVAELSFAVPATALGYILKTALAQFYLGERVTLRRWTGAICIALGVVLIAF